MIWKKNGISYLSWFLYTLMAEALLLWVADDICNHLGLSVYMAVGFTILYALCVSGVVFLLHCIAKKASHSCKASVRRAVAEAVAVVALLAVGFFLRVITVENPDVSSVYFDAARVVPGSEIPKLVHGATYCYLHLLRMLFVLMGNRMIVAVWMQLIFQMIAGFMLYCGVRKFYGAVSAVFALAFAMCAPSIVDSVTVLSPENLYSLLFLLTVLLIPSGSKTKAKPILFLPLGCLIALCIYLDAAGVLLLLFALAATFACGEKGVGIKSSLVASICCITGALAGFLGIILVDAVMSGRPFLNVIKAWWELYRPDTFFMPDMPVVMGMESRTEIYILVSFVAFGVFSFWRSRKRENISAMIWVTLMTFLAVCFGVFTEDMPGYTYLYFAVIILAGIGLGNCFCPVEVKENGEEAMLSSMVDYLEAAEETKMMLEQTEEEETIVDLSEGETIAEETSETQDAPVRKVQFLENPLPLPKKHEKRVLDYAMEVTDEMLGYDKDVSNDDDFDIK